MSWLGRLNYYGCQWLCFRICRRYDDDGDFIGWGAFFGVLPLTGWGTPYRYLPGLKRAIKTWRGAW
jgi:hypothetical protein